MPMWDVALQRSFRQGAQRFVLDLSFASDAHRVVLFGPSGAGKTQTLRLVAGIGMPEAGHVAVAGRTLYDSASGVNLSPQQRRIGLVFQDYALFPHLDVRQNIAFARQRGWRNPGRDRRDEAVERWIDRFELAGVAGQLPHQLSGGQRQRTALARALVDSPDALLLDEPFAALDRSLRTRLREELRELQAALAIPLLLITHDDDDVACLAEEVVELAEGRVVRSGRPH